MPAFDNLPSDSPATQYVSFQTVITTSPTFIATFEGNESGVVINNSSGATVFLGGGGVTTATGFPLAASTTITLPTYGGAACSLYGVVASTGSTISFIRPTA